MTRLANRITSKYPSETNDAQNRPANLFSVPPSAKYAGKKGDIVHHLSKLRNTKISSIYHPYKMDVGTTDGFGADREFTTLSSWLLADCVIPNLLKAALPHFWGLSGTLLTQCTSSQVVISHKKSPHLMTVSRFFSNGSFCVLQGRDSSRPGSINPCPRAGRRGAPTLAE